MEEDQFNMAVRKFLREVGVTSQREVERLMREGRAQETALRLTMTLTSEDVPSFRHRVDTALPMG